MKRKKQETESINNERRSKSKTPSKIKNDIKKAKNKWVDQ